MRKYYNRTFVRFLLGIIILILWFYIAVFLMDKDQSSTLAAWVQAVGSIAAIVGAFSLGQWQDQRASKRAVEDQRSRQIIYQQKACLVCVGVLTAYQALLKALEGDEPPSPGAIKLHIQLIDQALPRLDEIKIDFLDISAVPAFGLFCNELRLGRQAIEDTVDASEHLLQYFKLVVERATAHMDVLVSSARL